MQLLKSTNKNNTIRYPKLGEKPFDEVLELFTEIIADDKGLPNDAINNPNMLDGNTEKTFKL